MMGIASMVKHGACILVRFQGVTQCGLYTFFWGVVKMGIKWKTMSFLEVGGLLWSLPVGLTSGHLIGSNAPP